RAGAVHLHGVLNERQRRGELRSNENPGEAPLVLEDGRGPCVTAAPTGHGPRSRTCRGRVVAAVRGADGSGAHTPPRRRAPSSSPPDDSPPAEASSPSTPSASSS